MDAEGIKKFCAMKAYQTDADRHDAERGKGLQAGSAAASARWASSSASFRLHFGQFIQRLSLGSLRFGGVDVAASSSNFTCGPACPCRPRTARARGRLAVQALRMPKICSLKTDPARLDAIPEVEIA